jgi:hypothetical protein
MWLGPVAIDRNGLTHKGKKFDETIFIGDRVGGRRLSHHDGTIQITEEC